MGSKQAKDIVEHMLSHWFYEEGIRTEEPPVLKYTLHDMVLANHIVKSKYSKKTKRGHLYGITLNDRWIAERYLKMTSKKQFIGFN